MESERMAKIMTVVIKEAFGKACPTQPHLFIDMYGHERKGCPTCYVSRGVNEILYTGQRYCSVCGQRIRYTESVGE